MGELSATAIEQIIRRVFVDRETTLEAEAEPFDIEAYRSTIADLRRSMAATLDALPDTAFDVDEDAPPGEAGWSAGQIVSHNTDRLIWVARRMEPLLHNTRLHVPASLKRIARTDPLRLTREESRTALKRANRLLDDLFAGLRYGEIGTTTASEHHGDLSSKGWLLLLTIHDYDHSNQLMTRKHRQT